jgi:hypothetical protein
MTEETPVTAEEIKAVIRPVKAVLARLPENWQTEQAEKSLDTLRDHAMRSIEGAPAPAEVGKG